MTNPAAGWYPDPEDATRSRWWDGAQWTDNRSAPYVAATATADLRAPEGTDWKTAWIWLIVLLPLIPMIGLLTIDWSGLIDVTDPTGLSTIGWLLSPGYLLSSVGGWLVYGLCVWFAYLDWRELGRRGVPRPFHWAWTFLSSAVYGIGRSVVVRRRTGHGISPMWATIATLVVSFGVAIYISVVAIVTVIQSVDTLVRVTG